MNEQAKNLEMIEASLDIQQGNRTIETGILHLRLAMDEKAREVGGRIDGVRHTIHENIVAAEEAAWRWGGILSLAAFTGLVSFALTRAFSER